MECSIYGDDYKEPGNINYYNKFDIGERKIRWMSHPVKYWEIWLNNKSTRVHYSEMTPEQARVKGYACVISTIVWDYEYQAIRIFQFRQEGIRKGLQKLANDPRYGHPFQYDVGIIKFVDGNSPPRYSIKGYDKKPVPPEALEAFENMPINLNALVKQQDPFKCLDEVTHYALPQANVVYVGVATQTKIEPLHIGAPLIEPTNFEHLAKNRGLDHSYMHQFVEQLCKQDNCSQTALIDRVYKSEGTKNYFLSKYKEYVANQDSEEVPF